MPPPPPRTAEGGMGRGGEKLAAVWMRCVDYRMCSLNIEEVGCSADAVGAHSIVREHILY